MIRQVSDKLTTAQDTAEYLRSINDPADPGINNLLDVLDTTIEDYQRVIKKHAITEVHYWKLRIAKSDAAELLADHMDDYSSQLEGFDVTMTPVDIVTLVYLVLNDSLDQCVSSLAFGRRAKNSPVISDQEFAALEAFGL